MKTVGADYGTPTVPITNRRKPITARSAGATLRTSFHNRNQTPKSWRTTYGCAWRLHATLIVRRLNGRFLACRVDVRGGVPCFHTAVGVVCNAGVARSLEVNAMKACSARVRKASRIPRWVTIVAAVALTAAYFVPISGGASLFDAVRGVVAVGALGYDTANALGAAGASLSDSGSWGGMLSLTAVLVLVFCATPLLAALICLVAATKARPVLAALFGALAGFSGCELGVRSSDWLDVGNLAEAVSTSPATVVYLCAAVLVVVGSVWLAFARGIAKAREEGTADEKA
jgi:hypothetical protein